MRKYGYEKIWKCEDYSIKETEKRDSTEAYNANAINLVIPLPIENINKTYVYKF